MVFCNGEGQLKALKDRRGEGDRKREEESQW